MSDEPHGRTAVPPTQGFLYDPYGGEPRREDLDPPFDVTPYHAADQESGDDNDSPVPFCSFHDIMLSMYTLNAPLPQPTQTSAKRWIRRATQRCANVRVEDLTTSVADAFSDEYFRLIGLDDAAVLVHAKQARRAARDAANKPAHGGGAKKQRQRKGHGGQSQQPPDSGKHPSSESSNAEA